MKTSTILKALIGFGIAIAVGFEFGFLQRIFDSRSIVQDGVIGGDYWIVQVDGITTDRIQHGLVVTKVPLALLDPGDRMIALSEESPSSEGKDFIEFRATIEKGVDYRLLKDDAGNPQLVATE